MGQECWPLIVMLIKIFGVSHGNERERREKRDKIDKRTMMEKSGMIVTKREKESLCMYYICIYVLFPLIPIITCFVDEKEWSLCFR